MSKRSRKVMTEEEFKKWEPLPKHIAHKRFSWAYSSKDGDSPRRWKRFLDYEDLIQEGNMALLMAWDKFDESKASFMTYAWTAVYRRMWKFVDANITPVTTRYWQNAVKKDKSVDEALYAAVSCFLFSESNFSPDFCGRNSSDLTPEDVVNLDWVNFCIEKLRETLSPRDFMILMGVSSGNKQVDIAKQVGITSESVRTKYQNAIVKAAVVLLNEEANCG